MNIGRLQSVRGPEEAHRLPGLGRLSSRPVDADMRGLCLRATLAFVSQPLLFLDVDGVLNPTTSSPPPGFTSAEAGGFAFSFSKVHRHQLAAIAPDFEIVWATTWGLNANISIGPALGLPRLDAVDLTGPREGDTWKLGPASRHAGDRPLVWIDDELHTDAFAWAEQRTVPTLLIKPSGTVGLRESDFDRVRRFRDEQLNQS